MAQIFVSYARADRTLVAPLVAALEAQGWSLWWDFAITSGQEFDRLIASELDAAQAVIVVWTPNSVESRWVRGEAREGASRGVLVPVRFGNARLPLDVRSLHTTDLDNWRGASDSAPFQELVRALRRLLAEPGDPPPTLPATTANGNPQPRRKMMIAAGIGALVLVGIVGLLALKPQWAASLDFQPFVPQHAKRRRTFRIRAKSSGPARRSACPLTFSVMRPPRTTSPKG